MSYQVSREGIVTAGPWPLGMNNKQRDHNLPDGAARNIVNCDIDVQGNATRRKGLTKVYSGLALKGGYSCPEGEFFIEGNTLRILNADDSATILFSGILGQTYAWDYFNSIVYFTDGLITKKIVQGVVQPWGLPVPAQPALFGASGSYDPGTYLAVYTWVDANGLESGASPINSILLDMAGGITFAALPGLVSGATALRIYLTAPNGSVFYHVADTTANSYTIAAGDYDDGHTLETNFISPPPPGQIIRRYNGRTYIVVGNVVYYSEPYSPDHFKLGESFLQFPDTVTIMEPVAGGIFFATDKQTDFYAGNPEDGFEVHPKFDYGGIYGTGQRIPNTDDVSWMSQRGIIMGAENGHCENKQENQVATETGTSGAMLIREQDGMKQVIANINDPTTSNLAASSFIEAEIIRRA